MRLRLLALVVMACALMVLGPAVALASPRSGKAPVTFHMHFGVIHPTLTGFWLR